MEEKMFPGNNNYMYEMIRTELIDILGEENVGVSDADRFGHSVDYYWVPEMWHDRGWKLPKGISSVTLPLPKRFPES